MHLFRTSPLVKRLAAGDLSSQERAQYLLASFLLFTLLYYAAVTVPSAGPYTLPSLLEGILVATINVIGVVKAFDASGGDSNTDFVYEFTCLYIPVTVTTMIPFWTAYWAITLGYREALQSFTYSNLQFAMNLASLGVDIFGFLAFVANVGVPAVTFLRITKLLAKVHSGKGDA